MTVTVEMIIEYSNYLKNKFEEFLNKCDDKDCSNYFYITYINDYIIDLLFELNSMIVKDISIDLDEFIIIYKFSENTYPILYTKTLNEYFRKLKIEKMMN